MLPASYVIHPELIHVGEFERTGGFADVSKGEYQGRPVAVKHLRVGTKEENDKIFKVSNCTRLGTLQLLSFRSATLPGSSHLETPDSYQRLASVGSLRV